MRRFLKRLLSYLPRRLPVGMTAYRAWADDIIEVVGPIADERSLRWAIANLVMHAPSDSAYLSIQYFVKRLIKTAANQLSAQIFQDIKAEQEAEQKAAQDLADKKAKLIEAINNQVEATTPPVEASNENKETTQS